MIGSLTRIAENEGLMTYMMTPDKDFGQLVTDRVLMYRPSLRGQDFEIRGPKQVCERYGIANPLQVIDLLALEGDTSDNIPGCPGVGEKTASKLIADFGSVENLLENTSSLKGAMKTKIETHAEQIRMSKWLATIKTDISLPFGIENLRREEPDMEALKAIFTKLEFKSFLSRLGLKESSANAPAADQSKANLTPAGKKIKLADSPEMPSLFDLQEEIPGSEEKQLTENLKFNIRHLSSAAEISGFITKALARSKQIGVSVYAVGDDAMSASLEGIAISCSDDEAAYISLSSSGMFESEELMLLEPLFNQPSVRIVSHDVKRTMVILRRHNIGFSAPYFDTAIAHYLLNPEGSHELSSLAASILSHRTVDYSIATTEKKRRRDLEAQAPAEFHAEISLISRKLADILEDMLTKNDLVNLFYNLEMPMVQVLAKMEFTGVRIDICKLAEMSINLTKRLENLENEAFEIAGKKFNIGSPMQVGEILFDKLKIDPKAKRTKRGAWSTTEDILEKYVKDHRIVALILEIRGLRKLLATYIDALPKMVNPVTGKVHTTYNQTVTATGRISSTNPNLQNIPIRTEDGRMIRQAFIADKGCIMLDADYSQIELRLIADLSGDKAMVEAFLSNEDIHSATASKIYGVPISEVSADQRRNAKTANFGIIYGISAFGLSERLGIPRAEAKQLIDGYMATYPEVQDYINKAIAEARENGFVTTKAGRKRFLPDINSRSAVVRGYAERNAVNAPIQGSAADIIKRAMIDIYSEFSRLGLKSAMQMQVHDELIFNVVPEELETVREIVIRCMSGAYSGKVPLDIATGTGKNWLEAEH